METVKVRQQVDRRTLNAAPLAADYKARGLDKYKAWNQFIQDRDLRPELDAKVFYRIYEEVLPATIESYLDVTFTPNAYDTLRQLPVQISQAVDGVYHLLWSDGSTGSNPTTLPPDPDRFVYD